MNIRKIKRKGNSIIIIKKKGSITLSSEFDKKQADDFSQCNRMTSKIKSWPSQDHDDENKRAACVIR